MQPPNSPDADSLQFRKAEIASEPAGPACGMCRRPVTDTYYHVSGVVCCAPCSEARLAGQQQKGGGGHFGRALLFGAGAALAGSIAWAIVIRVIHAQFALLAIVIGVMVGKAVTYGARGCRGRRYQIAAVLLTYASITTSYFLLLMMAIPNSRALPPLVLLKVIAYSVGAPFLALRDGVGELLTLLIIFFGLQRAWRYTTPDNAPIMGPYPVTGLSASNP